jgi:hypothetical protein
MVHIISSGSTEGRPMEPNIASGLQDGRIQTFILPFRGDEGLPWASAIRSPAGLDDQIERRLGGLAHRPESGCFQNGFELARARLGAQDVSSVL